MSIDTKLVGKTYPAYTYEVGKEKIKEYAKAIKNFDPHYLDDDFAKKSKYGAIIAPPTFAVVFGAYLIEPVFNDKELNLNMPMVVHGEQELAGHEAGRVHLSDITGGPLAAQPRAPISEPAGLLRRRSNAHAQGDER